MSVETNEYVSCWFITHTHSIFPVMLTSLCTVLSKRRRSTLEHCIPHMYTVGVAGFGLSGIAGMQTGKWKTSGAGFQPPNRSWHKQWAHYERLFMSSWFNYTRGPNITHHVSTRDPLEDQQLPPQRQQQRQRQQAFMKATRTSLRGGSVNLK